MMSDLLVRALEQGLVLRYLVGLATGWATRAQPVDAQDRASMVASINDNPGDKTLLIMACRHGYVKVVQDILQLIPQHIPASSLEEGDVGGWTALHYAVLEGHEEVVNLLLRAGAQANCETTSGITPLMLASMEGRVDWVRMLLPHLAVSDLDHSFAYGRTALYFAADGGHEEVTDLLLSHGAHASPRDHIGLTPLMHASCRGHLGVVQILLQHMRGQGLDDLTNEQGNSALHLACIEDIDGDIVKADDGAAEGTVRALLLAGADATITDAEGVTPRTLAEMRGHSELVAVLDVSGQSVSI
jgi:ankyrin repeat protein